MITIKTILRTLTAVLLMVGILAVPASAQTALTTTTLSAAMTDTSGTSLTLASVTGVTAPGTGSNLTYLYMDGEAMIVRTVNTTSLVVTVSRGAIGTRAGTHAANTLVYVIPATAAPTVLTTVDYGGTCTGANFAYLPIINTRSGNIWNCVATTSGTIWQGWNSIPIMETKPRTVVAGVAYTILPTDYLIALSTTLTGTGGVGVAVKSFTLPSHVGLAGKQIVIKDESGGLTATTNIVLVGTIDGTNSGTATVIQMKTAFQSVGLEAGSGGWFTLWCQPSSKDATTATATLSAGCR